MTTNNFIQYYRDHIADRRPVPSVRTYEVRTTDGTLVAALATRESARSYVRNAKAKDPRAKLTTTITKQGSV